MDSLTDLLRRDPAPIADTDRPGIAGLAACLRAQIPADSIGATLAAATALLMSRHLRFDAADPGWPDRDRLVMSPALHLLAEAAARLSGTGADFAVTLPDPPGQSLGAALGLAMAERTLAARFGRSLVDHRTWVLATLGDLSAGLAQEAATAAAALRLGRLTVLVAMSDPDQCPAGLGATWTVRKVAADDITGLQAAMSAAIRSHKPTLIACTGNPAPALPASLTNDSAWHVAGSSGAGARRAWLRRLARHTAREEFDRTLAARLPPRWHSVFSEPGPLLAEGQTRVAPLATGRQAFARLAPLLPELVVLPGDSAGSYPWATHAQALACALGGMALHGGTVPIGYARLSDAESLGPALRAAAQAGLRVVHVVAEPAAPCPTAGHRAGLRAMRNVFVFRPADASETLECAELALRRSHGPSVLLLSEIACSPLVDRPTRTRCVHGGFLVREPAGRRQATLVASGAELTVALRAHDILAEAGIATAVVSLPCWELFANQEAAWRDHVLGEAPRIGLEAGSGFGWERWLGPDGIFVGSDSGAGACDITVERAVSAVVGKISSAG